MQAPELDDERFATGDGRQRHAAELTALLGERLRTWSMMHYFENAQLWGMGAGVVMNPRQVLECEQLAARGFFRDIPAPDGTSIPAPRGPVAMPDHLPEIDEVSGAATDPSPSRRRGAGG
jgi:crotonobetainyl-CoA:carnitine CoA-transferase CaiB-like acyl-CoA transferase